MIYIILRGKMGGRQRSNAEWKPTLLKRLYIQQNLKLSNDTKITPGWYGNLLIRYCAKLMEFFNIYHSDTVSNIQMLTLLTAVVAIGVFITLFVALIKKRSTKTM